jgi:hypothetical protein
MLVVRLRHRSRSSAARRKARPVAFPGGLLGMMERVGVIDPSAPDVPPGGGPVALLQEYLRSNREPAD